MNETIFTEILTKHGFKVEKEIAPWNGGGDWYVAYVSGDKFNIAVAWFTLLSKIDDKFELGIF